MTAEKVKEHDWHNMNMAAEFKENGAFVLNNLMSRISLQIAQITSSYGQVPLILPPANCARNAKIIFGKKYKHFQKSRISGIGNRDTFRDERKICGLQSVIRNSGNLYSTI